METKLTKTVTLDYDVVVRMQMALALARKEYEARLEEAEGFGLVECIGIWESSIAKIDAADAALSAASFIVTKIGE